MTKILEGGLPAPGFCLETAGGGLFDLAKALEQSQRGVIVYFYPKAQTPGCTTEACDFRDNIARLTSLGYTVVGVSPDKVPALDKFVEKQSLPFTLASDPDKAVATAYGAWGEKKNYGRIFLGIIRSTFVINKQGVIEHALYNVRAKGHVERVLSLLGGAQ